MSDDNKDEAVQSTLRAVFSIIGNNKLQEQLRDEQTSEKALSQLKLPSTARQPLLQIVNSLELLRDQKSSSESKTETGVFRPEIEKILLESFSHIRWTFWILLGMSILLFIIGLTFLTISVVRALNETTVSTATLTIAGVGIADFILLFYSKPWQDISTNLSNSQQVKIIAISYLSGLSLLQQGKSSEFSLLEQLTKSAVGMLEEFTEERASAPSMTSTIEDKS